MTKRFCAMLALVLAAVIGDAAVAQSGRSAGATSLACPFWQQLTFDDGAKACLGDYAFARAAGHAGSRRLVDAIGSHGFYALAATDKPGCPVVFGLDAADATQTRSHPVPNQRDMVAIGKCRSNLAAAGAPAGCSCDLLVLDGRVVPGRQRFEQVVGAAGPAPVQPPVAPQVAQPRPALPAAVAVAPQPLQATQAPKLSARALVIGNSRYRSFGVLANPGQDARAIAAKLRSYGIEVDLVLDAERDDMIHALNEYSRKAAGKDVNLLFYAGHGVQVEGVNYLIPVNMRADGISAGYIKLAGISLNAMLDYLPARTRLVFLDACRDNPASRQLSGTRSGVSPGLAPVDAASGTLIAYATRDGATAGDGDGMNSPYTTALLQHLDQPLDISLVLRQVRQTVLRLTSGRQEPWEYGSLVGDQIVLPLMAR
jgi:hypothetical protein